MDNIRMYACVLLSLSHIVGGEPPPAPQRCRSHPAGSLPLGSLIPLVTSTADRCRELPPLMQNRPAKSAMTEISRTSTSAESTRQEMQPWFMTRLHIGPLSLDLTIILTTLAFLVGKDNQLRSSDWDRDQHYFFVFHHR
ncbi:hypothetical protein ARMGADRAFT_592534 [Armillaria gallica]|uniref:Uncharacterized protein n=1 Tax=Armillaria gallica TaxID=47427 RepID=A0A2H3CQ02_ARMGA|nr:hypothetical protein ARMGADRAFT_592534 [Armillaria gallica]